MDSASQPRTLAQQQFYEGGEGARRTPFSKHQYYPRTNYGVWNEAGFSIGSLSDRLTDEQREDLIAENIYDWWISGKSYKKWYADKFLQLKFDLSEDNETQTSEENNGVE